MFFSILTSAIRSIMRNRAFSLINMTGLAISMSLGLLIILIIKSQYSFDTFHADTDRIYRINTEALRAEGGKEPYASVPLAVANALVEEYGYTEKLVQLDRQFNGDVTVGKTIVPIRGLFANPSFLEVFNFPFQIGDAASALTRPNTVVLTREAAVKLFGEKQPLGEVITVSGYGEFTVTGVLQPFMGPTHFEFEALVSFASVPVLEKDGIVMNTTLNWKNYYTGFAYLKLKENISPEVVEEALAEIFKKNYSDVQFETRDKGYRFYLQSLTAITPGPILSNNMGRGMPELLLIFLGILATIVMLMACFNYTQLMIAKSLVRAKEIGVRKIVGAHRWQVFIQFVGEAVLFALVSLVFSYLLLQFIKPGFQQLHLTQEFTIDLSEDFGVYGLFLLFAVAVGTIAGLLPAGYLSAFKPLNVLRSAGDIRVYTRLTFRKILMVTQFTLSLVFILFVITVYRQVNFMVNADYGFNQENIVNIRLTGVEFEKLANGIRGLSGVTRVGGISHSLGTWADGASDYRRNREDAPFVMRDFSVDENYLLNLEVPFVAGNNFMAGSYRQVVLNEKALGLFGFERAEDAVGQPILVDDTTELIIAGVVSNFNFRPLNYEIGPVAFRYDLENITILSAKISGDRAPLMARMEAMWKSLEVRPFDARMMADEIDTAYEDAGFFDVVSIVGYITVVAITLACLGMLGMAMYAIQTRVKEIGVRKVLGATSTDILVLLSKSFMYLIGISIVIGTPASLFLGSQFLNIYAYKISMGPGLILTGILFLVALGTVVICSQTFKASRTNPVKSLRYE